MSDEESKLYPWRKNVKTLPSSFETPASRLVEIGHIPELSAFREKVREQLGMERNPPTAYQFESARLELQELVKDTDLYLKVAWNWRKKKATK